MKGHPHLTNAFFPQVSTSSSVSRSNRRITKDLPSLSTPDPKLAIPSAAEGTTDSEDLSPLDVRADQRDPSWLSTRRKAREMPTPSRVYEVRVAGGAKRIGMRYARQIAIDNESWEGLGRLS